MKQVDHTVMATLPCRGEEAGVITQPWFILGSSGATYHRVLLTLGRFSVVAHQQSDVYSRYYSNGSEEENGTQQGREQV